jgi:murein DD-endopeptidase MepM/ murein hydrolase activator NlpD
METLKQVKKLKLNVTTIHSFLVKRNKEREKINIRKKERENKKIDLKKKKEKERKLELPQKRKISKQDLKNPETATSSENILDRFLNFGGLIFGGILVNSILEVSKQLETIVDSVVNFVTPIQSGFNLIKAFFTGEIDQSKFDADKKRVDDTLKDINGEGGLIDKLEKKMGPLGGLIKALKPAIELLRTGVGGKNMVLAKKGGKEGVLNKETGEFTERQFTSAEREKYEKDKLPEGFKIDQGDLPELPPTGHISGQKYGASRPGGRLHAGTDFDAGPNDVFYSRIGGEVVRVLKESGGYGNYIDVYNKKLNVTERIAEGDVNLVKVGDIISPGTPVQKGTTQTGVFHYEIRKGKAQTYGFKDTLDPIKFLNKIKSSPAKIEPTSKSKEEKEKQAKLINQEMDDVEVSTIFMQQVNTTNYVPLPMMIPIPVKIASSSSSSPSLSPLWST